MVGKKTLCPYCQAETYGVKTCWLCKADLTASAGTQIDATDEPANPYRPPTLADEPQKSNLFSIILLVGIIIVFVAIFFVAPGLGIMLAIVTTPALIRTSLVIARRQGEGEVVTTGDKSLLFMASVGGMIVAFIAAAGAFFIACSAACFGFLALEGNLSGSGQQGLFTAMMGFSGLVAVAAGALVLRLMWRKRR